MFLPKMFQRVFDLALEYSNIPNTRALFRSEVSVERTFPLKGFRKKTKTPSEVFLFFFFFAGIIGESLFHLIRFPPPSLLTLQTLSFQIENEFGIHQRNRRAPFAQNSPACSRRSVRKRGEIVEVQRGANKATKNTWEG